ncbi:MAG: SlyX family protein [Pseudomonadota bacterium]
MTLEDVVRQLEAVQTQTAYHEDTIAVLNEAMAQQQQEIMLLRRQLELLKQRQDEQGITTQEAPMMEPKPPHY